MNEVSWSPSSSADPLAVEIPAQPGAGRRPELHRLVDLLSDDECARLHSAVADVAAGQRFWEDDSGLFYNEYIKLRYFRLGGNAPTAPAIGPESFIPISVTKGYPGAPRTTLPPPRPLTVPLDDTVLTRRSRRDYTAAPIELDQLATLLGLAAGVNDEVPAYGFDALPLRTFPTHGGLQTPEIYACVRDVTGLAPGIHHYHPRGHALELVRAGDVSEELLAIAFNEEYVRQAQVVLMLTAVYDRLRWKYGERAYRFMCTDIGFLGQNLCLVSTGLGLGACPVSGFAQDRAEELLAIDGRSELAILLLTLGTVEP